MVFFPSYWYLMNIFNLLFKFFIQNPASYLTFPNSPNCFNLSGRERLLSWLGAVEIIARLELRNIWCGCLYLWYLQYPSSGLHYLSLACLVTGGIFLTTATVYSTALITIVPRVLLFLTATRYHVSLHSLALAYCIQTSSPPQQTYLSRDPPSQSWLAPWDVLDTALHVPGPGYTSIQIKNAK